MHTSHVSNKRCTVSLVTYHVSYVASRRVRLVVTNRFPVNCSLYESRLLSALDASRHSAFMLVTVTVCRMTTLSCNNILWRKKDNEFWVFHVELFRTPTTLLEVLTISVLLAMLKNTW